MTRGQKWLLALLIVCIVGVGAGYYYLFTPRAVPGASSSATNEASAETPYGERLEIRLNTGTETSGSASWLASYSDSASQQVYTVDGTYADQEQVTLSYSLTVTYSNVNNIKATVKIKAVDQADSSYHEYALASNKALSGASPISDSGSTTRSIVDHLTDCDASTSSATIKYHIYCKVTGTGAISGETLTAEIPYTEFCSHSYQKQTESATADVTPIVSVASWYEILNSPEGAAIIVSVALLIALVAIAIRKRPRGGGRGLPAWAIREAGGDFKKAWKLVKQRKRRG